MQVDLFKSRKYSTEFLKNSKKIEKRGFSLNADLNLLDKELPYVDKMTLDNYKGHLFELLETGRQYNYVGQCGCDNLFELEALGVGQYCKEYTVIIDFSTALDYVLHRCFGCSLYDIRKMPRYEQVSRSMLNYDFSSANGTNFGVLFDISPELNSYLAKLLAEAENNCMNADVKMPWVVYKFYTEILSCLSNVKDYVITYVSAQQPAGSFIYRSKSFSSVLASSSEKVCGDITLVQQGFETYTVPVRCYKQFEYARERVLL